MKQFKIPRENIRKLVSLPGLCIAPDTVMVDGLSVELIYRVMPSSIHDSGWRIFSGSENQSYLSNPRYNGLYELNTVINYCPEIIPLLNAPPYSAFRKNSDGNWMNMSSDVDWRTLA